MPPCNMDETDDALDLDVAAHKARQLDIPAALNNSFGFGATTWRVFTAPEPEVPVTTLRGLDPSSRGPARPRVRPRALFDAAPASAVPRDDRGAVGARRGRGTPAIAYVTEPPSWAARWARRASGTSSRDRRGGRERVPVLGRCTAAGARLAEGVVSLDAGRPGFAAMVRAGSVPQISVVLGPAAGGAAYGPR